MAAEQSKAKIPVQTDLDPKELDKLTKSVLSIEQAPTSAAQTPGETQWQGLRDTLGPPFDSERVTLRQMRQLRKDPMISFALHYRKVPIAKAEWYIEARDKKGVNAQVAAFVDACLRKIYARYIFQRTLAMPLSVDALGVNERKYYDKYAGVKDVKRRWMLAAGAWNAPAYACYMANEEGANVPKNETARPGPTARFLLERYMTAATQQMVMMQS